MIAHISTNFYCTEEELWKKILQPKSLQFVAFPILSFKPLVNSDFDGEWVVGKHYDLKMYFLTFVPLGFHRINIVKIDKKSNIIESQESGSLVSVWNHTIHFGQLDQDKLIYADEIEVKAGWLTMAIWLFAQIFYRHRQRRWKILLS